MDKVLEDSSVQLMSKSQTKAAPETATLLHKVFLKCTLMFFTQPQKSWQSKAYSAKTN
jgi:hypothetical protein